MTLFKKTINSFRLALNKLFDITEKLKRIYDLILFKYFILSKNIIKDWRAISERK